MKNVTIRVLSQNGDDTINMAADLAAKEIVKMHTENKRNAFIGTTQFKFTAKNSTDTVAILHDTAALLALLENGADNIEVLMTTEIIGGADLNAEQQAMIQAAVKAALEAYDKANNKATPNDNCNSNVRTFNLDYATVKNNPSRLIEAVTSMLAEVQTAKDAGQSFQIKVSNPAEKKAQSADTNDSYRTDNGDDNANDNGYADEDEDEGEESDVVSEIGNISFEPLAKEDAVESIYEIKMIYISGSEELELMDNILTDTISHTFEHGDFVITLRYPELEEFKVAARALKTLINKSDALGDYEVGEIIDEEGCSVRATTYLFNNNVSSAWAVTNLDVLENMLNIDRETVVVPSDVCYYFYNEKGEKLKVNVG